MSNPSTAVPMSPETTQFLLSVPSVWADRCFITIAQGRCRLTFTEHIGEGAAPRASVSLSPQMLLELAQLAQTLLAEAQPQASSAVAGRPN
jgi:hypothetical protein